MELKAMQTETTKVGHPDLYFWDILSVYPEIHAGFPHRTRGVYLLDGFSDRV